MTDKSKSGRRRFLPAKNWALTGAESLTGPALIVLVLLLLVALWCMYALLATGIAADLSTQPPWLTEWTSSLVLKLFGLDRAQISTRIGSVILSFLAIIVSLLSIVVPIIAYRKYRLDVNASRTVEIKPIRNVGRDDLETLADLIEEAKEAIIFAGSFDWLAKNSRLKTRVQDLAAVKSLVLVSNHKKEVVQESLSQVANGADGFCEIMLNRLVDDYQQGRIRLTVVRYASGDLSCCTMVTKDQGTAHASRCNLIVRPNNDDGRVLLNILDVFCDIQSWKARLSTET